METNTSKNSSLIDFTRVEALHSETITKKGSYVLEKDIDNYRVIDVIMQYGNTNWIKTQMLRIAALHLFPNIVDSVKSPMFDCYYNIYINKKNVNVGDISSNTRIIIRGII